ELHKESLQVLSSTYLVLGQFEECITSDLLTIKDFKIVFVELWE
ncbi:10743_t:CDS:1, partial [Acaulospora morrowiae]